MIRQIANTVAYPLRLLLDDNTLKWLNLDSMHIERVKIVQKHCKGRLLDIGCGSNTLVKSYGDGVGVDVYPWPGVDKVVKDTSKLPFKKEEFDTVSILAALNHIPNREDVVKELNRVMKSDGRLLITMLTPTIGFFRHKLAWWDADQHERGLEHGEKYGMSIGEVKKICRNAGFKFVGRKRFAMGLNNLLVFKKK